MGYLFILGVLLLIAGFNSAPCFLVGTGLMIIIGILFVMRAVIRVLKS